MHAFVSHWSASDVLRLVGEAPRWPESTRPLPPAKDCVSGQRDFRECRIGERLDSLGLAARPVDLIVPAKSARSSGGLVRAHLWSGIVPQRSMLDLGGGLLSCGAELIVIQLCSAQSKLDALLDAHASAVRAEAELAAGLGLEEGPPSTIPSSGSASAGSSRLRWSHVSLRAHIGFLRARRTSATGLRAS